jgi:hypothetical protein
MDSRKIKELERAIEQGETFSVLSGSPAWPLFRSWMEQARDDYERLVHATETRQSHVNIARALEGYDALNNVLVGFDRAIANLPKRREELDDGRK